MEPKVPLLYTQQPTTDPTLYEIHIHPHLCILKLPKGLFPSGFLTRIPSEFLFATMHATFPAHLDFA
jgi:hypothetical protein